MVDRLAGVAQRLAHQSCVCTLLMADVLMRRSVITYRAVIKYYFCLIWLYILLSALNAVAFISYCGVFNITGSGGLTITRVWHRLIVGPSATAPATFMSIGLLLFGLYRGKPCYSSIP